MNMKSRSKRERLLPVLNKYTICSLYICRRLGSRQSIFTTAMPNRCLPYAYAGNWDSLEPENRLLWHVASCFGGIPVSLDAVCCSWSHTSQIKILYVTTAQSDYLLETQIKSKTAPAYSGLLIGFAILLWFPFVRLFIFLPICFSFRLYLLLELAPGACAVYM
jgi:hypothetical protein